MRWPGLILVSLAAAQSPPPPQVVAGSDWVGDGGRATAALLVQVEGLAADSGGNLYISDADGHRIRRVLPDGIIRTLAGTGARGFSGDGGPAVQAHLYTPYGVAPDSRGNLYIADLGNARVRKVTPDGRILTVAGGGTLEAAQADGGPATLVKLVAPRNLAADQDGNLYFSDFSAHRVYRVGFNGTLTIFAGNGVSGYGGDGGPAWKAQLSFPTALAIDRSGALYIADSENHLVRKVAGGLISTVARATTPTGLAIDAFGTLYVADWGASQILRFPRDARSDSLAVRARDVAVDSAGRLYASSGALVQRIAADGTSVTAAGGGDLAYGDGGPAREARLNRPASVARDAFGNLYIADRDNHRIRKVTPGGIISTVVSGGQLNSPAGVAADANGNLYVADTGNRRVARGSPSGVVSTLASLLDAPAAVALDSAGQLYVAETSRIRRIGPTGALLTMASDLESPAGLALDAAGNLYFSEPASKRVRKLAPNGDVSTLAAAAWNTPRGIAVSGSGEVFVADGGRILRIDGAVAASGLSAIWGLAAEPNGTLLAVDAAANLVYRVTPAPENAKVDPIKVDPVRAVTAANAASLKPGPVAPAMLMALDGAGLSATEVDVARVLFSGIAATPPALEGDRLYVRVPAAVASLRNVEITVEVRGTVRARASAAVATASPGLFATVFNEDSTPNSAANPASRGAAITLWGTGEGIAAEPFALRVGDYDAEILWAGPAYGYPGLFQINARVPSGYAPPGVLPVVFQVGSAISPPVNIATR